MGSTFMLCTVDQESGVTSLNVYALLSSASSRQRFRLTATLLPCRANLVKQKRGPLLRPVVGVSKGMQP